MILIGVSHLAFLSEYVNGRSYLLALLDGRTDWTAEIAAQLLPHLETALVNTVVLDEVLINLLIRVVLVISDLAVAALDVLSRMSGRSCSYTSGDPSEPYILTFVLRLAHRNA